jgi:hypothetical protein
MSTRRSAMRSSSGPEPEPEDRREDCDHVEDRDARRRVSRLVDADGKRDRQRVVTDARHRLRGKELPQLGIERKASPRLRTRRTEYPAKSAISPSDQLRSFHHAPDEGSGARLPHQ